MKKKSKLSSLLKGLERENRKEQGFFDGRFSPKVIKDKKKQQSKDACRKFK